MTLITTPIGISYQAAATDKTHSKLNLAIQEQHLPLPLLVKKKGRNSWHFSVSIYSNKRKINLSSFSADLDKNVYLAYQSTPVKITKWFLSGKKKEPRCPFFSVDGHQRRGLRPHRIIKEISKYLHKVKKKTCFC